MASGLRPLSSAGGFPFLIGEHPTIERVQALIAKLAPADTTVVITGESGTGKELAARAPCPLQSRERTVPHDQLRRRSG